MLEFVVWGTAAGQGSKRPVGRNRMIESSPKTEPWREAVRGAARRAMADTGAEMLASGPLQTRISARMPRPKHHYRTGKNSHILRDDAPHWYDKAPDIDKMGRAILDALTSAGVYGDDRQVAHLDIRATYCNHGEAPHVVIGVSRLP